MKKKANYYAIGLFVIASFAIAVGTFIAFGSGTFTRNIAIIVSTFRGSANGLREGAKVKAYGVEVGQVKDIKLHRMEQTDEVVIPVLMEIDLDKVSNLLGFDTLEDDNAEICLKALERNAHATLQLDSFVTGLLYVEIVFGVNQPGFVLKSDRFSGYRAMPTIATDMEKTIQSLQQLAQNLRETDVAGLVGETRDTIALLRAKLEPVDLEAMETNINKLVSSASRIVESESLTQTLAELPDVLVELKTVIALVRENGEVTLGNLNNALAQVESAAARAGSILSEDSPVYWELLNALEQIGDVSRSLRVFVDYLEQNPNALITGRAMEEPVP